MTQEETPTPPPPDPSGGLLKTRLDSLRTRLAARVRPDDPRSGDLLLGREHALMMDEILRDLFMAAEIHLPPGGFFRKRPSVALAAVGSYGRGSLAICSDLDVRLLVRSDTKSVEPFAKAMLYPLWDAGTSVGHQIVTLRETIDLARHDLATATTLLDWRHIAGDVALSSELAKEARNTVFSDGSIDEFLKRLQEEVNSRHKRFGGSVYLLEPDVRNGAGGLRDLDVTLWAARARWNIQDLSELVRVGVLVQRESNTVLEARSFFWRVRNRLHRIASRRSDRLTFETQEELCGELGYGKDGAAVEAMMSDYYRHAREVNRIRDVIFHRAFSPPRKRRREEPLHDGLRLFDGQVSIDDAARLQKNPELALQLYQEAVNRNVSVYPYAREAVMRATQEPAFCDTLRESREAARLFVSLCTGVKENQFPNNSVLAQLDEVGLLMAMIPEFSPVMGRVHHDVYHVYTVDVHSVAAVDRLRALARGDRIDEFPLACRLAAEISNPTVLFIATLLHDVGKAIGGKDHAIRGAEMSRTICARLGLPDDDIEQVFHLIENHLVMYHTATRRDIDDPVTINDFARIVREREGLRELYLLTVVDISTTSPTAMTSWKARMLDELYNATDALLSGQTQRSALGHRMQSLREEVLAHSTNAQMASEFLQSMDERYLLSHTAEQVAAHVNLAMKTRVNEVGVSFIGEQNADTVALCVIAPDRPGLLSIIAAAITACRIEIQAAQIHSRSSQSIDQAVSQAVDIFWVRGPGAEPSQYQRTQSRLKELIEGMLNETTQPESLLMGRSRSSMSTKATPAIRDEVILEDRKGTNQGIIEVLTRDRPGLVFALAKALHELGLTITVAKINTEGMRVADVFYVKRADGSAPNLTENKTQVRDTLLKTLDGWA